MYLSNKLADGSVELVMVPNSTAFSAIITIVKLDKTSDFFCDH